MTPHGSAVRRLLAFAIWPALCPLVTLVAAEPAEPVRPPVHFTVFSASPVAGLAYRPKPEGELHAVEFYPTARSPRYVYESAEPLRFFSTGEGASTVAAEVALPPEVTELLLLFAPLVPRTEGGPLYRVYVLDDGAARRAGGTLAIVNFSGLELRGMVDGRAVMLREGLNAALSVGPSSQVELSVHFRGRSYRSYVDTIVREAGERALLILLPPFSPGSVEVQSRLLIDVPR